MPKLVATTLVVAAMLGVVHAAPGRRSAERNAARSARQSGPTSQHWLVASRSDATFRQTAREGGQQEPSAQPARFAGTWVGTQAWAVTNPPPGASRDQPVTLTLEVVEGKLIGTMVPFLGGEDGATIVDSVIVGEELRATAVVGRPRTAQAGGRRGGGPGWKDAIRVAFVFRNDGVTMSGTADVKMSDVPWVAFTYELGRKRSRY